MSLLKLSSLMIAFYVMAMSTSFDLLSGMVKAASADQEVTGLEWTEPARLITRSLLLDIAVNPDRIIAVGERGHVLLSSDQGRNWTQVLVPTQSMLNAVTVVGDRHSWIVGHDSVILHSADNGETWDPSKFRPSK